MYIEWDRLDEETKKRHLKEFKVWVAAIFYGLRMVKQKKWNQIQRKEYMLEVARQVRLPYQDLEEMKLEIENSK